MNRQQKRRLDRLDSKTAEATALICMIVLHDCFGFGEKRLSRFMESVNTKTETLDEIRLSDLIQRVEEITGWKVEM